MFDFTDGCPFMHNVQHPIMKSKIFGFVMRRKHGNVYEIIVFSFNNSLKLYIIIICLFLQLNA